jgi:hypothetical protein
MKLFTLLLLSLTLLAGCKKTCKELVITTVDGNRETYSGLKDGALKRTVRYKRSG